MAESKSHHIYSSSKLMHSLGQCPSFLCPKECILDMHGLAPQDVQREAQERLHGVGKYSVSQHNANCRHGGFCQILGNGSLQHWQGPCARFSLCVSAASPRVSCNTCGSNTMPFLDVWAHKAKCRLGSVLSSPHSPHFLMSHKQCQMVATADGRGGSAFSLKYEQRAQFVWILAALFSCKVINWQLGNRAFIKAGQVWVKERHKLSSINKF